MPRLIYFCRKFEQSAQLFMSSIRGVTISSNIFCLRLPIITDDTKDGEIVIIEYARTDFQNSDITN
jgi:hypothetical protein